jgi:hypothetical protein
MYAKSEGSSIVFIAFFGSLMAIFFDQDIFKVSYISRLRTLRYLEFCIIHFYAKFHISFQGSENL